MQRNQPMKRRKRPFLYRLANAVLDRIIMDVIHVMSKIDLIPNLVLPKPSLPQGGFSMFAF